ncbi:ABC transporter ATP-binding protein [Bacillus sp. FSL K6-3431]|uniref:ABC transporter ATP-binding protein n=1 Tax=Bacillus sp. FSL K6-3431 TaxID=2921500 RepID=UPI0030FA7704
MTSEMLTVKNLSFSYDETEAPVLRNLSFSLKKGESMMLLGPSGSGKSSLTLCLNGLYPSVIDGHLEGSIQLFGKSIADYLPGEASKHIGVVFQDPEAQFCMLTVEDEIAFGLENIKIPREKIAERIGWALQLVGLEEHLSANIAALSGGMKQKLALACVLAMKPDLIILDEPTALLDPITTKDFAQTIKRLQAELQFSLIVIEHKLDHWISFMDKSLVFSENGEVIFEGTPKECFKHYRGDLKNHGIWLPKTLLLSEQLGLDNAVPLSEKELLETLVDYKFTVIEIPLNQRKSVYTLHPILETTELTYTKSEKSIIKNMNIRLPEGALTAIVGPNGAGKSTLSYLLAGLVKPTSGKVLHKEKSLRHLSDVEMSKTIGYVFQNPEHQFIADTVYEEIAFSLKMQKRSKAEIKQIVEDILGACRLQHLSHQHPFALSQGQKRRLSVATMMVDEQPLLILDEPTYGQDARTTEELMKMVNKRLEVGFSAIMITHDMELVSSYADYVIVIIDGEVLFQGTPHLLFLASDQLLEAAHIELPIAYSLQKKLTIRGEAFAASYT